MRVSSSKEKNKDMDAKYIPMAICILEISGKTKSTGKAHSTGLV